MAGFNFAPIARIVIRYGVGAVIGLAQGEVLAGDPDLVTAIAAALGVVTEVVYGYAVKRGWAR